MTVRLQISTSPLFALFTCRWMLFQAVLGNTDFELVVFGVTFAVVSRRSTSGHGVSVLVLVTGRFHLIPLFKNLLKKILKFQVGKAVNIV